ncbi:unnamed protein product [Caenorhabditis bovis]|uniref:Sphingomyelin synthase-like domain-containing protein n=1 Tax=Caenorhabditis bovis TaxID=2654633 RepID=A0A8S1ENP8_9PELO|nr:unnamed protein product [Caenorhabditis bovis]
MGKNVEFRHDFVPASVRYSNHHQTDESLCERNTESQSSMGSASRRAASSKSEILKCVFLFVFLFIAGVSNWAVIAYTHDFVPRQPLPDVVFSLVAEQEWASIVGDICVAVCLALLAGCLLIHAHRFIILRRVVFIAACLYSMRSVTLAITQLPSGYRDNEERCREKVSSKFGVFIERLVEQTIRVGFQGKRAMLCGDLLFSGHTLVMVTCSLSIAYYLPRSIKRLQYVAHLACLVGMACMVISRTHYSIDVVIAYWLSNFVFRVYHAYCEVDMCMERRKSILYSWWPCKIIDWLEESIIPGRIENRMELPWNNSKRLEQNAVDAGEHHKQSSSSTYPLP